MRYICGISCGVLCPKMTLLSGYISVSKQEISIHLITKIPSKCILVVEQLKRTDILTRTLIVILKILCSYKTCIFDQLGNNLRGHEIENQDRVGIHI